MSNLRQAAQQALVAMKSANHVNYSWACVEAVAVLEAALAEDALQRLTSVSQEIETALAEQCPHGVTDGCKECYAAEQEPVAWMDRKGDLYKMPEIKNWAPPHTMLYTTPPQRKPLTDAQVNECGMCGYVGKDKDKTGQCPKCRWDELRPLTGKAHQKPLTDDQIYEMYNEPRSDAEMLEFARAIEAAHGIKGEA